MNQNPLKSIKHNTKSIFPQTVAPHQQSIRIKQNQSNSMNKYTKSIKINQNQLKSIKHHKKSMAHQTVAPTIIQSQLKSIKHHNKSTKIN